MDRSIPIELAPAREIAIDGGIVARALGLEVEAFRQLMHEHKVAVLCERGTGIDEGLYRASFYIERKRARLVVDAEGHILTPVSANDGG